MTSLTVIIPNYNHGTYLAAAVAACLRPHDAADEVIVVDDASTDSSVAMLEQLAVEDPRVRLLQHRVNRGPAAALNTGIAAARSDWVFLRGADDLSPPGSLTTFRALVDRFPDAGVIAGDPVYFETNPRGGVRERLGRAGAPVEVDHETFLDRFGGNIIHGPFCRTDWVRAAGGLDEHLRWHCDWFLFLALGLGRGFVYAPEVFSAIRLNWQSYNAAGTEKHDTQRRVLERLVAKLEGDSILLDRVLACGCLDFFGEPLLAVLRAGPAGRLRRFAALLAPPTAAVVAARRETGIASVLRAFLSTHGGRITEHAGSVSVFGAGGHTRQLLDVWRELALPLPSAILDASIGSGSATIDGIPVRRPEVAAEFERPLVILSSRSYEPLLASRTASLLPGVPFLKIWGGDDR